MASPVGSIINPLMILEPATQEETPRADLERRKKLNAQDLVGDPQWDKISFRGNHFQLDSFLREFQKFMNGESSQETLQSKLDAVLRSSAYKNPENQAFYDQFFRNLRKKLGSLEVDFNKTQAQQVLTLNNLPEPAAPQPAPEPTPAPPPDAAGGQEDAGGDGDDGSGYKIKDRYFSIGGSLELNRLSALALRGLGFNADGFVRQQDTTVKVGTTFSVGQGDKRQVMGVTVHTGGGKMTSIPGSGLDETGGEYHFGADVELVNPHPKKRQFESAGIGLQVIGVSDHAGKGEGVPTPAPVARLRFTRQTPWAFNLGKGKNFQLSVGTVAQDQEVNFALNNPPLQAVDEAQNPEDSPLATAGNLFPTAKVNLGFIGFRWWPNGAPQHITREDLVECDEDGQCKPKKFQPGEGLPKVLRVFNGGLINLYRRIGIYPAYANNRIFLGTFETFGASSRDQYDLLGIGLSATTALDGHMMANNAKERAEIMRRGSWLEWGALMAVDGVHLITDIALAATAKKDPPEGQTLQEFIDNPGMVTDFRGRGGRIDLTLFLAEWGLTGLDWSGATGHITDEKKGHYVGTRVGLMVVGALGYLFSAKLSGAKCGTPGTGFLGCGFATTGYMDGQFFDGGSQANYPEDPFNDNPEDSFNDYPEDPFSDEHSDHTSPKDLKQIQRQSIWSVVSASLVSFGLTGLLDLGRVSKGDTGSHQVHPGDIARKKRVEVSGQLSASQTGAQVGVQLKF